MNGEYYRPIIITKKSIAKQLKRNDLSSEPLSNRLDLGRNKTFHSTAISIETNEKKSCNE
jgi:hypothetical protein